jgi:eukaryotic-like serine/threonine-protein kinase
MARSLAFKRSRLGNSYSWKRTNGLAANAIVGSPSNSTLSLDSSASEVGEFRLLGRLAHGRHGDVYYAVRKQGGGGRDAWLALKQLAPELAIDRQLVERWLRAIERAAPLVHPELCRTVRSGTFQGTAYCAMELCAGLDLARICAALKERGETMPIRCAAWIMSQVAGALEAAHGYRGAGFTGLAHGNLNPSDVIVGYDGSVKVISLGLSKAFGPGDAPSEATISAADVDTDVVALGRCLSALIAAPAEASSSYRPSSVPEPPASDSEPSGTHALRMIAARAIKPRAGARFASAAAVQQALDQFLAARGASFTVQALSSWMTSSFQSELNASLAAERRILEAAAPEEVQQRGARASLSPRRLRGDPTDGGELEVTAKPPGLVNRRISAPPPRPASLPQPSITRSDPDKTPPKAILAERLASEMWTDEPTRVGQVLWETPVPAPPEPPPVRGPSKSPLLTRRDPLWPATDPPQAAATAFKLLFAAAVLIGVFVALTERDFGSRGRPRAERSLAVPSPSPPSLAPEAKASRAGGVQGEVSAAEQSRRSAGKRRERGRTTSPGDTETAEDSPDPAAVGPGAGPAAPGAGLEPAASRAGQAAANRDPRATAEAAASTPASPGPAPQPNGETRNAVPISRDPPRFPALARSRGVHSGNVLISFTVDPAGKVRDPIVVDSDPPEIFDAAGIEAVSKWRYRPSLQAGVPVESPNMRARLEFSDRP